MSASPTNIDVFHHQDVIKFQDNRDKILLGPFNYITEIVAKDTWRQLAKAFNYWLNVPEDKLKVIEESYQKFYYADLLFDDIRDNSSSRGDRPSSHSVHGMPCTLNALIYAHHLAAAAVTRLNHPQAPCLYLEQVDNTCSGRWMEQYWSDTVTCPTEDAYYHMIVKKTYGLLTIQIKFMQLFSANQDSFTKLSAIFGLYFHVLEDYLRFNFDAECEGEIYREDVPLEKFTLPIIHAIKSGTYEGEKVIDILRRRTINKELKKYAMSLLERNGSFEYTKKILVELRDEALREISKFEKNPFMEHFVEKYLNIPVCAYKMKTRYPAQATEHEIQTLHISSYLNQMNNIQCADNVKEELLKPYKHINSAPKRNLVLTIIKLFNNTIKTPEDKFAVILKIFYYAGYACLLLDDIQDTSILRRGIPCAYLVYGVVNTVNAVIYTYSMALRHVLELNHPQAISAYYEPLLESFRGQGMDLYWRDNFVCPTEDEYMRMVAGKTGNAFVLLFRQMKLFSSTNLDVEKLPALMSLYFQAHDDYQNLNNQEYYDAKGFCEDLTEGKFGFPTIHAINTHPKEGEIIMDILRQRTYDVEVKKYCLSVLEKCGSFEYTKNKLKEFQKNMFEEMQKFTDNRLLKEFIGKKFYISLEDINEEV